MSTEEMLPEQMNEVLMREDEENVSSSRLRDLTLSTKESEVEQRKRRKESNEMQVKKKAKLKRRPEDCFKWRPQDCAHAIGTPFKFTGEGENKKCHYETFKFHSNQYELNDSVLLVPEDRAQEPYVAIIKDIYIEEEKDGYVKLDVQWFYRPEDVRKSYLGKWESKDKREIFYSFHRDVVSAESVKRECRVYFVPENKQIPKLIGKYYSFIVQKVYDPVKKKLRKFNYKGFVDDEQKHEIDVNVAKTISIVGDLPDIEKVRKTRISRRKRSVPKRFILNAAERASPENVSVVDPSDYESTWVAFESLSSNELDRDKRLEELLEAVKDMCRKSKEKQAGDNDSVWPDDVVPMVRALEQTLYDSFADNIQKYNYKSELLVENLKNSPVLARRLLNGELKLEQTIKMTRNELACGFTFIEKAYLDEPMFAKYAPSTSKTVGRKDVLED